MKGGLDAVDPIKPQSLFMVTGGTRGGKLRNELEKVSLTSLLTKDSAT